jgi:transglutaminase-like putative cysteine protease
MRPVKQVLSSLNGNGTSMDRVKGLLREGKSFRYSFTEPYVAASPSVTAKTRSGDCKAKSLWLCNELGDRSVRYVIGKARSTSKISHAWVMWNDGNRWWILDPTNSSRPIAADSTSRTEYIPLYSYDRNGCYRHSATQIYMANAGTASKALVAGEKTKR